MYNTIISVPTLADHLGAANWVVIDCRFNLAQTEEGRQLYANAHIPGSFYAHLDDDLSGEVISGVTGRHPLPNQVKLVELVRSWGTKNDSQVVVYDQGHGGIAARLWWLFQWMGHEKVAVLDGGWTAWTQRNLPVESVVPAAMEGDFQSSESNWGTVDSDRVAELMSNHEFVLVDSRAEERYLGLVEPIDPIAGHIDGAINRPFLNNVGEDGLWKSTNEIRDEIEKLVGRKDADHTIFYCGSGVTACHNILAYKYAMHENTILYPGSWSEWLLRL